MAFLCCFAMLAQVLLFVSLVEALDISYCSPDNTGSSFEQVQSNFQSNGACQDTCKSSYAFAVIEGQNCWCTDYAPDDSVSTLRCNDSCPGYPTEWCGSSSSGLYAYFQLAEAPSGTSVRSSAEASSTPATSVSGPLTTESPSMRTSPGPPQPPPVSSQVDASLSTLPELTTITTQSTAPASSDQPTVTVTEEASSPSPSSSEPSTTTQVVSTSIENTPSSASASAPTTLATSTIASSPSPTAAPSLVPSVITVTQDGTTITSTASVTPSPDPALGQGSPPPSGSNPGRMAGIAIGAAAGLAAVLGLVFWLYLRRKQRNLSIPGTPDSDHGDVTKGTPRRHASQMSQAGLIDKNPRIITTGLPGGSSNNSAGTSLSQSNRYSLPTDVRLNPNAIYTHEEAQHSSVSFQDNRDYSRQLQIRNPDS